MERSPRHREVPVALTLPNSTSRQEEDGDPFSKFLLSSLLPCPTHEQKAAGEESEKLLGRSTPCTRLIPPSACHLPTKSPPFPRRADHLRSESPAQFDHSARGVMTQNGVDFHLPDEILAVIPTDPYDQLDLARKITSMAIASRVSRLEGETWCLRQKVAEKDRVIAELQERLSELDKMFQEADARLRTSQEENIKLSKERDSLSLTTKKLSRELAKLEAFKRQLMQSLSEDDSSHTETVDIGTCDQSISKASTWKGNGSVGHVANFVTSSTNVGNTYLEGSRNVEQKFSMTPYISPRLTPTATPTVASTGNSPRGLSTAGSPKMLSGTTSPTKHYIGQTTSSPWYPSSQLPSAASSPPRGRSLPGRTPRIDGKEFFRQARNRLSYEQFGAFLANIKELNAHRQSREETLKKTEEIFGTDNNDLYLSFQGLLNRNIP